MNDNERIVPAFEEKHDESLDIVLEKIEGIDKCLLLQLTGYIDTYNTTLFQKKINLAIEAGYIRLIFDCSSLNYFSSTGIGSFTSFLKAVKPQGGDVVLFGMQQKLTDIFKLLGFSQFFSIYQKKEEALAHFKGQHTEKSHEYFPKIVRCPTCSRRLRAVRSGRFRCNRCRGILVISARANVTVE